MFGRERLRLYFIMGSQDVGGDTQCGLQILQQALQDGITLFQWREKGLGSLVGNVDAYRQFARDCQQLCQQFNVPFIVNDDVALALELDADGVHIGQDDADVLLTRNRLPNKILGVSAHSVKEVQQAADLGADYVGLGPIFPTLSKLDAEVPTGLTWLMEARHQFPSLPIVAIGGISLPNVTEIIQAGADGVAVISAICKNESFVTQFWQLPINQAS